MTVLTKYFNWSSVKVGAPYNKTSPGLKSIMDFVMKKWSGQNLGTYGVRTVRGGTSTSTHSYGAAWDYRYSNPGPGRAVLVNEIIPFLINNSKELGVQAIHDYFGCQVWHAGRGWRAQAKGSHGGTMGQTWATWVHIEVHPDEWSDGKPVETKLGLNIATDVEQPLPEWNPKAGKFALWPLAKNKPTIKMGSSGDAVRYLQGVILNKAGGGVVVDGGFGSQTDRRVRDLQAFFKLPVDGVVGPKTWPLIDMLASK